MQNNSDITVMNDILHSIDTYNLVQSYSEPNYKKII